LGAVIFIIVGLLFCAYGGNYLYVSSTTNSAIHELNGVVGIGLGLLMFGVAWMLGTIGGIRDRVRDLSDASDEAAASTRAREIVDAARNPLLVLLAIARAAGEVSNRQSEEIISYLRTMWNGDKGFGSSERRQIKTRLESLVASEDALRTALEEVRTYGAEKSGPLIRAADAIVKTSKPKTERQQRVYNAAFP